jgi:hypothetical protein
LTAVAVPLLLDVLDPEPELPLDELVEPLPETEPELPPPDELPLEEPLLELDPELLDEPPLELEPLPAKASQPVI